MDTTQHLIRRVRDNRAARARSEAYSKWIAERRKAIDDSPDRQWMDFWCNERKCKKDIIALGYKVEYTRGEYPKAVYKGRCERGHEVERRITDRHNDPYFYLSEKLKYERWKAGDDLLQPSDPRFKTVYPRQWEKLQAEMEEEKEKQAYMDYVEHGQD